MGVVDVHDQVLGSVCAWTPSPLLVSLRCSLRSGLSRDEDMYEVRDAEVTHYVRIIIF